jgi:hypothetical protein
VYCISIRELRVLFFLKQFNIYLHSFNLYNLIDFEMNATIHYWYHIILSNLGFSVCCFVDHSFPFSFDHLFRVYGLLAAKDFQIIWLSSLLRFYKYCLWYTSMLLTDLIPLTLDTITILPLVFVRWGTHSCVRWNTDLRIYLYT